MNKHLAEKLWLLSFELDGVLIDSQIGQGLDTVCIETLQRVSNQLAIISKIMLVDFKESD